MKNILFSTTRQYNPGDEFILFGILNILDECSLGYNTLIFNRHPLITPLTPLKKILYTKTYNADNSFFLEDENMVDYIIIAGSPDWRFGRRIEQLFQFAHTYGIKVSFIAVGAGGSGTFTIQQDRQHNSLRKILQKQTELITVRDEFAFEALKDYKPVLMPCTALFASKTEKVRSHCHKIGLVFQNNTQRHNSVGDETFNYLIKEYRTIMNNFKHCEIICHTMQDLIAARQHFSTAELRYSALSEHLIAIYDEFDVIVGTRVHGAGIAASLGIPSILIDHSGRALTAKGFKSVIVKLGTNLSDEINRLNLADKSQELIAWKKEKCAEYVKLFKDGMSLL